jgi:hypothetical protein
MGQPFHTEFATNLTGKKLILLPVWFYGRKVSGIPYFPLSFGLLAITQQSTKHSKQCLMA